MAAGDVPGQLTQDILVKDLGYQTHGLVEALLLAVRRGDPGRLLPAVLQCEEGEIREPRHVALDRPDSEDAAHL